MIRMKLVLVISLLLAVVVPSFADSTEDDDNGSAFLFDTPFRLELRAGYTGTMWSPKGLEPYQVNNYGRELFYGELAVLHPLIVLGDAFDVIQIPRLRIETNLGYTRTDGAFEEVIPRAIRDNAYLRTTSWITMWRWFSFRYRQEKYDVTISSPDDWVYDEFETDISSPLHQVQNEMTDLEFGVIGSPDGEIHETMVEIGYYHSAITWPMALQQFDPRMERMTTFLSQRRIAVQGVYFALNTQPNPQFWPFHSQLMVRFGGALGLDARFRYEHKLLERWFLGLELDSSYRVINNYTDENEEQVIVKDNNPRDTRYKITLYTVFVLL